MPPRRFARARFDTYLPNEAHPSQQAALDGLHAFAVGISTPGPPVRRALRWRRSTPTASAAASAASRPGRYLDGGFGVGKTHLLAALWHTATAGPGAAPAAYLTFAELTAVIGFLGMEGAVRAFAPFRLLCIDEFELDDVANTLMAVSFLRQAVEENGARVAATSNSLPDRLGEGRFHASDFRREIAAIGDFFEVVRIDGPDYRARSRVEADARTDAEADELAGAALAAGRTVATAEFDDLLEHLRRVHPVQYHGLFEGADLVVMRGLRPIANQGDALLFVHLVDELYDAELAVVAAGCHIAELFPPAYRNGGYRKKYGRCESRLAALAGEVTAGP